jgi:hypothetical protein
MSGVDDGARRTHGSKSPSGYDVNFSKSNFNATAFYKAFHFFCGKNLGIALSYLFIYFLDSSSFLRRIEFRLSSHRCKSNWQRNY